FILPALLAAVSFTIASSFGRDLISKLMTVLGLKLGAFWPLALVNRWARKRGSDIVDCSIFSPPSTTPGSTVLVQVFLHIPKHAKRAKFAASLMDQSTKLAGVQTLQAEIERGASVTIELSSAELTIDEPASTLIWSGQPTFCQFLVSLPRNCDGKTFHVKTRIIVGASLIGRIVFCIKADVEAKSPQSAPQGEMAGRYNHAFLSYASSDRKEVLKRAQVLAAAGVSFFHDTLSLDPGARWEREIYKAIDKCDLFLLFWS